MAKQREARDFVAAHREEGTDEVFGIAELADAFGVTHRAIRFYETKGLLSPRRVNGSRIYNRRDRARLALILRGKALGMSLADLETYLELYGRHGEGRVKQLRWVIDRTGAAITELEDRKAKLEQTLAELRHINEQSRVNLQNKLAGG